MLTSERWVARLACLEIVYSRLCTVVLLRLLVPGWTRGPCRVHSMPRAGPKTPLGEYTAFPKEALSPCAGPLAPVLGLFAFDL